jgi:hypothetical protein
MGETGITVDPNLIQQLVEQAIETNINKLVDQLCADPEWTNRVERLINQAVVQETMIKLGSIDFNPMIKQRIDENMEVFKTEILADFSSTGISDQASACQLTIMDDTTVVENCLTTHSLDVVGHAVINNLIVKGSINTDNSAWSALSADISQKTLSQLTESWKQQLVKQVAEQIAETGIDFKQVTVDGVKLIDGNRLSNKITETNIQTLGTLKNLQVQGEAHINNTVSVLNNRVGINTEAPEMAFSVWDEEVSVVIGKHKAKQAYIGTNRDQSVAIGVNRTPHLEISVDGLTTVKQLQIGLHKISHANTAPGWLGTRGDIVFNSNFGNDRVFAWVCLGGYKWQTLKSAE